METYDQFFDNGDFDCGRRDIFGRRYIDTDSKWVNPHRRRDKISHPYNYDEFFIHGNRKIMKAPGVTGDYSDRLWQWNYALADRLWKKHVNKRWDLATLPKLSKFITAYQNHGKRKTTRKKFEAVALVEGCNASSGYPYWIVFYRQIKAVVYKAKK